MGQSSSDTMERRDFIKVVGTGTAGISLAGCVGQDSQESQDTSDGSPTESQEDQSNDKHMENELVNALAQTQSSFDPARATDAIEALTTLHIYDPVLTLDPETQTAAPHLATDWESENDGKTWVLTLRNDVSKHHGGTLTADDIAYTMERTLEMGQGNATYWQSVLDTSNIEVRDDQTIAFNFEEPFGPFINTLTQLLVLDKQPLTENEVDGDYGRSWLNEANTAGTGPYTIENWQRGSVLELTAFNDYWQGWEENQFGKAKIENISEVSTSMNKMRLGEIDILGQELPEDNFTQMEELSNVKAVRTSWWQLYYMQMNTSKEPLDDPKVREAFFYSLDYGSVVNDIIGDAERAAGVVPKSLSSHHNGEIPDSEQDPERAKAALEESNYTVEEINELEIEIMPMATQNQFVQTSILLQNNLREILGVEVEVVKKPWNGFVDACSDPETTPHIAPVFQSAGFPSAFDFLNYMFLPPFGTYYNAHWWENEDLITLLIDALTATAEERTSMYEEAQNLLFDAKPQFWIANPEYKQLFNENVGGWTWYGPRFWDQMAYHLVRDGEGRASL